MKQLFTFLLFSICAMSMTSQVYQDLTSYAGINVQNANSLDGQGISFHDFNDDGWDDLTYAIAWQDPKFYLNNGDNTFTLLAPFFENNNKIRSILWVDFDNDGDSDLFVTYDDDPFQLWQNDGDFEFQDISVLAGFLETDIAHHSASWGDFDRDGHLDIYVSSYYMPGIPFVPESLNQFYRNLGNGTFENNTISSDVGDGYKSTLAISIWDYNNDLWPDLYSVNDRDMGNGLYRNDSALNFVDVSWTSNTNAAIFGMSASAADYDNDGFLDMYCTNDANGNLLLRNNGAGGFINSSASSGTQVFKMSWAASWLDYDNDGLQDLYVCTQGQFEGGWIGGQNLLFKNEGSGTFSSVEQDIGLSVDTALSYCAAIGDLDRNGFADIAQHNLSPFDSKVFRNLGGDNHFISVELEGVASNKDAIGSWIKVYVNGIKLFRYTHLGENYMGQNSQRELIGIGEAEVCDSIIILWPSGHCDSFYNVQCDQWLSIEEGQTLDAQLESSATTLCSGDSVLLTSNANGAHIWSTGQVGDSIYVNEQGWFSALIENEIGLIYSSDSILIGQAPELSIEAQIQSVQCYAEMNGSIELSISSSDTSSIIWSNGDIDLLADSLGAGPITCAILDNWGCSTLLEFSISEPELLTGILQTQDVSCWGESDGSVEITPAGGTPPYEFLSLGNELNALGMGQFNAILSDSNQCVLAFDFSITEPDSIALEIEITPISQDGNGSAMVNIEGGTPPYSVLWNTGDTTLVLPVFESDNYSLIVTDSHFCTVGQSIDIPLHVLEIETYLLFAAPNPFSNELRVFNSSSKQVHYQLIGSTGAIWSRGTIMKDQAIIPTSMLPRGLWILRLEQGSFVKHQILVKH
ncbi:MAG: hypothetical protein ACI9RU_000106 [Litorivivens sp.]|jgi:hypothetical protein